MTEATTGLGTTLSYLVGATPTLIGELVRVQPPQPTLETADATHLSSPGGMREFIVTIGDGGEAEAVFNFTPAAYAIVSGLFAARELVSFVLDFPQGDKEEFDGLITGKPQDAIEVDGVRRFTMPIKVSGEPEYTAPSGG